MVLIHPNDFLSYQLAVLTKARSVVVNLSPIVPDYRERQQAVRLFLSDDSARSVREKIVETYGVTGVLLTKQSNTLHLRSELENWLGPPVLDTERLVLFNTDNQR